MNKILNRIIPKLYGSYFNCLAFFSRKRAAKKAFELFCTPRKGKVLPHQKDFLDSAKAETIEADGVHFQTYHWEGTKDSVLLLHGWESNTFRWRNMLSFLRKENFTVIALDAPAHGYSSNKIFNVPMYVEGVHKIIERHRPKHIVAHSVGGMTAIYHQHLFPDTEVEKIVTLGSPSEFSAIIKGYKELLRLNKRILKAMDVHFLKLFGFSMSHFSTAKFSEKISVQGLLIHDELDKITSVEGSEDIHANWKNSTLIKTKGLGHSLHQDEVSEKIIDFLKS